MGRAANRLKYSQCFRAIDGVKGNYELGNGYEMIM